MKSLALVLALVSTVALADGAVPAASIRTQDVNDICSTKTGTIRDVSEATKQQVYRLAGVPYGDRSLCSLGYEVDHRISLEVGGTNDISNLQLQAYCTKAQLAPNFPARVLYDAHAKDQIENQTHAAICARQITPAQGQASLFNWHN